MDLEQGFLAAIAAEPEHDGHRLVFADWLEENGQPARAELIRLQCRLEPDRDRFDDDGVNALHRRVNLLLRYSEPGRQAIEDQDLCWFQTESGRAWIDSPLALEWRRGLVEAVGAHAGLFVRHGHAIRRRYPLLRKIVVFALNGWGERLAACEWLDGVRELELACWYSDDDARAVAGSPHLRSVERLVCWSGGGLGQAETLARGAAWPALRQIHLVSAFGEHVGWAEAVDAAAGRPVGSVYVFDEEPFPFAHDFYKGLCGYEGIFAGKLPDGTQLLVREWWSDDGAMAFDGHAFGPDGAPLPEPFRLHLPHELWRPGLSKAEQRGLTRARKEFLRRAAGFEPALVRVRLVDSDWLGGAGRFCDWVRDAWGAPDAPNPGPATDQRAWQGGNGAEAWHWVRAGMFMFYHRESEYTFTRAGRSTGDAFIPW